MKRVFVMVAAVLLSGAPVVAQEPKRSEVEIFFLRTGEFAGKTHSLIGKMAMADETSAQLSVLADRLGQKTFSLRWKEQKGQAWEDAQLQCGAVSPKNTACNKVKVTGIVTPHDFMKDRYFLADAEYEFVK